MDSSIAANACLVSALLASSCAMLGDANSPRLLLRLELLQCYALPCAARAALLLLAVGYGQHIHPATAAAASLIMQSHLMQRLKKGFIKFLPCALNWWQLLLPILVIALEATTWTVF